MPKIVSRRVIALPDSRRLSSFMTQKDAREFEIFPAIDGRTPNPDVWENFDFARAQKSWGYTMPASHAACTLSHYRAARGFALQEGAPEDLLLIAEDDARFTPRAGHVLRWIEQSSRPIELLILADGYGEGEGASILGASGSTVSLSLLSRSTRLDGRIFHYGPYSGAPQGAGLYLISRAAARKYHNFIMKQERPYWPADWFHFWADESGIRKEYLHPGIATWEGDSSLGHPPSIDLYNQKTLDQRSTLPKRLTFYSRLAVKKVRATAAATAHDVKQRCPR